MNPASVTHPFPEDVGRRPRPAPLLPAALGMVCGIVADYALHLPLGVYLSFCVPAVAGLFMRWPAWVRLSSFAGAVALGGILHDGSYRRISPDHIVRYVGDPPVIARVYGTVVSAPRLSSRRDMFFSRWMYDRESTRFLVEASSIEGRDGPISVSGTVAVKIAGGDGEVRLGDSVEMFGKLYRPPPPSNPGQFDFAQWQRRRGVLVAMVCPSAELVATTARSGWRSYLAGLRARAHAAFIDDDIATRDQQTALLETMVLGDRHAVDPKTEQLFIRTGTAHFLAVSGAHVGVIAGFVWFIARFFGGTRRRCAVFVIAVLILYVGIVEPRPPIFRATIIGLVYCFGMLLRRTPCAANSISLAMMILLAIRPPVLFGAGFQLSFAGVYAICYLSHPLLEWWHAMVARWITPVDTTGRRSPRLSPIRRAAWRLYHTICSMAAVGTAACLVSTPLVGIHFGHLAMFACVFGLLLMWPFTLTVFLGFVTVMIELVSPGLAFIARPVAEWVAGGFLWLVESCAAVSLNFVGRWSLACVAVYTLVVCLLIGSIRFGKPTAWSAARRWTSARAPRLGWLVFLGAGGLTVAGCAALLIGKPDGDASLRITHLSVGRGTAAVIEFPNGKTWLYDCGTNRNYDPGASTVVPFLQSRGIGQIDRVILSHPNLDHFGGVLSVIDAMPTGPITVNASFVPLTRPQSPAEALLEELRRRDHSVKVLPASNETARVGNVLIEILRPTDFVPESTNGASIVLRLTYRGHSILMCGDIEEHAMAALMRQAEIRADALVLPHHGGIQPNTAEFIAAVDPTICIRSASQRTADSSKALREAIGSRVLFNTADDGAVTLTIRETGLSVHGFLPREAARSVAIPLGG